MSVRVYLPSSLAALAGHVADGGVGPSPVHGHAVTGWLRESWPEADEEEWEYAALMAAAEDSAVALTDQDTPRRVVLVAEVESAVEDQESSAVTLDSAIPMRFVQAVHADTDDVDRSSPGDVGDLGWFGVQEISSLLH